MLPTPLLTLCSLLCQSWLVWFGFSPAAKMSKKEQRTKTEPNQPADKEHGVWWVEFSYCLLSGSLCHTQHPRQLTTHTNSHWKPKYVPPQPLACLYRKARGRRKSEENSCENVSLEKRPTCAIFELHLSFRSDCNSLFSEAKA